MMGQTLVEYEQGKLYERLVDKHEVFDYYYEVLVFLAVVGYREGRVKRTNYKGDSTDGTKSEASLQNVHTNNMFHTVATCLAFQDTNDPEALVDESEHKRVIAQYAAGGLEFVREEFGQNAGDPTDAIVNYIKSREDDEDDDSVKGELQKIVEAFDDQMMDRGE